MACKYIYKGHEFKSELELDDFLIERLQYYSTLGDIVFDLEVALSTAHDLTILEKLNDENKDLRNSLKSVKNKNILIEDGYENDDVEISERHIIGVNKFWQYQNVDKLLLIFDKEEYFRTRLRDWEKGNFNDNELEIIENVIKKSINEMTNEDFLSLKREIENKWDEIKNIGTITHNVLEVYFKNIATYSKLLIEQDSFIQKLEPQAQEYFNNNKDKLDAHLLNARDILNNIVSTFGHSINDFMDHLVFYPELVITEKLNLNLVHNGLTFNELMGIIDLLVVDKHTGKKIIIDYKASPKKYGEYTDSKKVATKYQLYSYGHMLHNKQIDYNDLKYFIAPIHIREFKYNETKWDYSNLKLSDNQLEEITFGPDAASEQIRGDISSYLPHAYNFEILPDEALKRTMETIKKMFPELQSNLTKTEEELKIWFYGDEKNPGLNLLKDTEGHYTFKLRNSDYIFVSKSTDEKTAKGEIFILLKQWYADILKRNAENVLNIKKYLLNGSLNNEFNSDDLGDSLKAADKAWLNDILHEYEDNNWQVVSLPQAEALGIIVLRHATNDENKNVYDFITIAGRNLKSNLFSFSKDPNVKSRKYLTGHFNSQEFSDIYEDLKLDSFMLQGVYGNAECVKTAVFLNSCTNMLNLSVGNIKVINPYFHLIFNPTNKEILYSYDRLRLAIGDDSINLVSGKGATINFLNIYELCNVKFYNILLKVRQRQQEFREENKVLNRRTNAINENILYNAIDGTSEERLSALRELSLYLEKNHIKNLNTDLLNPEEREVFKNEFLVLYMLLQNAILEAQGLTLRLQITDHEKYIPSLMILRDGLASNYIDNAGNLKSETLNFISKNVFATLQNSGDLIVPISEHLKKLVDELRDAKDLSVTENMIWGNLNRLYSEMTLWVNGEWLFKMPSLINNVKARLFLEYALDTIAKHNKYYIDKDGNVDEEKINADKANPFSNYYKVPLMQGGLEEVSTSRGILEAFKAKISFLNPVVAYERALNYLEGIDNQRVRELLMKKKVAFFKMTNMFDLLSDPERRQQILASKIKEVDGVPDLSFFEHNIEKIVLQYTAASIIEKNMNNVFPLIKAAYYHLVQQGINVNTTFKNDIDYLTDYIKNKIFQLDINSEQFKPISKVVNSAKSIASVMTLGLAPALFTYQALQGLWVVIKVFLTNLGNSKIKLKHYTKALKIAYSDILKGTDDITLPSEINKLYRLNDINLFRSAQVFSLAKHGIMNMTRLLYKFATRPDYYNRLTLFLAQMDADGCLDAHSIENGYLVYRCEEDERYAAFLKGEKNNPNYEKAKSAYYAAAVLFVNERALVFNKETGKWEDFKIDMENPIPLPRAYTSKETESIKSLADELYGYYDEEKKSLIHSVLIGGMWLQMKTFWSGKKNQYLAHGGIKLRGEWKHMTRTDDNGNEIKQYYKLNQKGLLTNEMVDEGAENASDVAVILWTGTWQEGILLSLAHIMSINPLLMRENFMAYYYNPNPLIRNAFRQNFYRFAYDIFMMVGAGGMLARGFVAGFVNDLLKENKDNKDLDVGISLALLQIANKTLSNSFLDFNFIESIGEPLWSWLPFTFSVFLRDLKNTFNWAIGDTKGSDVLIKSFAATNQTSAFWKTLANQSE